MDYSTIFKIIAALSGLFSLACMLWTLFPKAFLEIYKSVNYKRKAPWQHIVFFIFAGIGWAVVIYSGIYNFLWFLPDNIGNQTEDGWVTVRHSLSATLTFYVGCLISQILKTSYRERWKLEEASKEHIL